MRRGGFELRTTVSGGHEPGTWMASVEVKGCSYLVPVDLIVPEGVLVGGKTRGARLPVHGKRAAKRASGLEAALVDRTPMVLRGLDSGDDRSVELAVADVAGLLVAKVHKIADRSNDERRPHRLKDKDAGDIFRLLRATPTAVMTERLGTLREDPVAGPATAMAIEIFLDMFNRPRSPGVEMTVRAVELDVPAQVVRTQVTAYVAALRTALGT